MSADRPNDSFEIVARAPNGAEGDDFVGGHGQRTVPGYQLLGEVGRGDVGVVYKARKTALNRAVALKMFRSSSYAGAIDLTRFGLETDALTRLQNPHFAQVYEIGQHEGRPFIVREYVEGGSLAQRLSGTPLPAREAAYLVQTLARALAAAHELNIVHRNLKPANVLLAPGGVPKITDFGFHKKLDADGQTASGADLGTPSYLAPEQVDGKARILGPATDVYALGAILYECLTGRPPFIAATPLDTLRQVRRDEPAPPRQLQSGTPAALETICLKCLEKHARQRYPSAAELADDLLRFEMGEPIRARPGGLLERGAKWVRRRPKIIVPGVAAVVVGFAVLSFFAVAGAFRAGEAERASKAKDVALKQVEIALADQMLLPLGQHPGAADELELQVLDRLADLPDGQERVRTLFVERALDNPNAAEGLTRRADLAMQAVVGLDRARRRRMLVLLQTRLEDPQRDSRGQLACVESALALGADEPAFHQAAARVLTERLTNAEEPATVAHLAQVLRQVANRQDGAGKIRAGSLASRSLIKALARSKQRSDFIAVGGESLALADRLDARDATAVALAVLQVLNEPRDPNVVQLFLQTALQLAPRLDAESAETVANELLKTLALTADAPVFSQLADVLAALSGKLDKEAAVAATQRVMQNSSRLSDDRFALVMTKLTADQYQDSIEGIVQVLLYDLRTDMNRLAQIAATLRALAPKQDAVHAQRAAATVARVLVRAAKTKDADGLKPLAPAMTALADRLDKSLATDLMQDLLQIMDGTENPAALGHLADALAALASRLGNGHPAIAQRLLAFLHQAEHPGALVPLVEAVAALDPTVGRDVAADAAQRLVTIMGKPDGIRGAVRTLADALMKLSAKLDHANAALAAQGLLKAMGGKKDPAVLGYCADAMKTVTARMEPVAGQRAAATASRMLLASMANTEDVSALCVQVDAISELFDRVAAETARQDAGSAAAYLLQALHKTDEPQSLALLARAVQRLAKKLDNPASASVASELLAHLQSLAASEQQDACVQLVAALQAVLDQVADQTVPRSATTAVKTLVAATAESTSSVENEQWGKAMNAVAGRLDRAGATAVIKEILQALDRSPTPAAVSQLAALLPMLIAKLDDDSQHEPAIIAVQRLLRTMARTSDPDTLTHVNRSLPEIVKPLNRQELVNLLKAPYCTPHARGVLVDAVGATAERTFADVWALLEWLEHDDPATDAYSPFQKRDTWNERVVQQSR